ncbi:MULTISPECIES: hypothetical protein [Chryseobacterium]|nr:hypothetical protein [Chryseobacterium sp.]
MKKYTKYLFFFSFIMSLISLVMGEIGRKEIYPFASWKLFTVPCGGEEFGQRYKLYGVKNGDTLRILNTNTKYYTDNDMDGIINAYGGEIDQNNDRNGNMKKLLIFAKDALPEFQGYLLYKEKYRPIEVDEKKMNITKTFITKL